MSSLADSGLGLPELPDSVPEFVAAEPELVASGPAAARPFLIEGEHGFAEGSLRDGIRRVVLGGGVVAADLALIGTTGVNFVTGPGLLRREIAGSKGLLIESAVVARTLPLVAVQWSGASAGAQLRLHLSARGAVSTNSAGDVVVVQNDANPDLSVAVGLSGAAGSWEASPDPHGQGTKLQAVLASDGLPTLFIAAGSPEQVRAAFNAGGHMNVHAIRAGAAVTDVLTVRTGIAEVDDGIAWAAARLRHALQTVRLSDASPHVFWAGLGALGVGDTDGARHALDRLTALPLSAEPTAWPTRELAALLSACLGLATGEARFARAHAEALITDSTPGTQGSAELWRLTTRSLANALRYAETPELIERVRSLQPAVPFQQAARRLPMAEGDSPSAFGFLEGSLTPNASPPSTGDPQLDGLLHTWSAFQTEPQTAWISWRTSLNAGLERGPRGPGTWDGTEGRGEPVAGALLCALTYGLLGFDPDTPSGRARIAPSFPSHLTDFAVNGLQLGDSRIGLRYTRDGSCHSFELDPTMARVPPVVVLEPAMAGSKLVEARVDGATADLDFRPVGDRIRARVQVPLDGPRVVEFITV